MKHIQSINEWFGFDEKKDGDDFAKELIEIIKDKNIKIRKDRDTNEHTDYYRLKYDKYFYKILKSTSDKYYLEVIEEYEEAATTFRSAKTKDRTISKVEISEKIYKIIEKIYGKAQIIIDKENKEKRKKEEEIERKKNLANLPTISPSAIMGKKYNL